MINLRAAGRGEDHRRGVSRGRSLYEGYMKVIQGHGEAYEYKRLT